LPYHDFVGLWLNLERADWRLVGILNKAFVMGKGELPAAVFDALAVVEGTAEASEWNENTARLEAMYFGRR
jgi:hypothetical protein